MADEARSHLAPDAVVTDAPGACWCGNRALVSFGEGYWRCPVCETLVRPSPFRGKAAEVGADDEGFYGREYWLSYQSDTLHNPTIHARARADLSERCLWWLRTLVRYRVPPGRTLELGCAHGGFVALMRQAGFEASGLELSPWVSAFAREAFGVPVLQGPVEAQAIEPGSLDVIVMMDVLEHLEDPVGTMRRCFELLKQDGIVLVQTPQYREGATLEQLGAAEDPFLLLLKSIDHLFLFSRSSVERFFHELGAQVRFEPAIFAHYDMCLVASRGAPNVLPDETVAGALERTTGGRLVQAMLDLLAHQIDVGRGLSETKVELALRHQQVQDLSRAVEEGQRETKAVRDELTRAHGTIEQIRREREAQLSEVDGLTALVASRQSASHEARAVAAPLGEVDNKATFGERWQARTANLRQAMSASLGTLADREQDVVGLTVQLGQLSMVLDKLRGTVAALESNHHELADRLEQDSASIDILRGSRWYRALVAAGAWRNLDRLLARIFSDRSDAGRRRSERPVAEKPTSDAATSRPRASRRLRAVMVDLTLDPQGHPDTTVSAMLPPLIGALAERASNVELLLVGDLSDGGLAAFPAATSVRWLPGQPTREPADFAGALRRVANTVGSPAAREAARRAIAGVERRHAAQIPNDDIDVVLRAFPGPDSYDPLVPAVAIVGDLEHRHCPESYSPAERSKREGAFSLAKRVADHLICLSESTRRLVIEAGEVPAERISFIPPCLPLLSASPPGSEALSLRGLEPEGYVLYPAGFFAHKNHETLLEAFRVFRARHPSGVPMLLCTGAGSDRREALQRMSRDMGMADVVMLTEEFKGPDFAAVLAHCRAIIVPSRYEPFAMFLLEGMRLGRPVACSDVSSLREVVGKAAILFDPGRADAIAEALDRVVFDAESREDLARRGRLHAATFEDRVTMADRYLAVLQDVCSRERTFRHTIHGVVSDGWTGGRVVITYGPGEPGRRLALTFSAPAWGLGSSVTLEIEAGDEPSRRLDVPRGGSRALQLALPDSGGFVQVAVWPLSQPRACGMGSDERLLGCQVLECSITGPSGSTNLLPAV
jgi:glycosyltransferase involved in cell wall biosynthesis/2-polyprenyl-3-methyl-5-hydroxy-6-metoxy-1,4-benzoquinol methylase